jgi:hypothetical protein
MLRWICAAAALQFALLSPALACEGQTGKVIFDDNFEDDSGGWDLTPPTSAVKPPNLVFDLSKAVLTSSQVLTFHAKEADFCVEATIPKAPAPDNSYYIGLVFWAADYANYWLVVVSDTGNASLWQRANGNWQNIFKLANVPGLKAEGSNALRVKTLGGKISVYLNNQLLKAVRAQIPDGDLRFGAYGQLDKSIDVATPILVSHYTVTAGQ